MRTFKSENKSTDGFFLLDAVISLLVVSVVIIELLVFVLNAGGAGIKINMKIMESIERENRSGVELFEVNTQNNQGNI